MLARDGGVSGIPILPAPAKLGDGWIRPSAPNMALCPVGAGGTGEAAGVEEALAPGELHLSDLSVGAGPDAGPNPGSWPVEQLFS